MIRHKQFLVWKNQRALSLLLLTLINGVCFRHVNVKDLILICICRYLHNALHKACHAWVHYGDGSANNLPEQTWARFDFLIWCCGDRLRQRLLAGVYTLYAKTSRHYSLRFQHHYSRIRWINKFDTNKDASNKCENERIFLNFLEFTISAIFEKRVTDGPTHGRTDQRTKFLKMRGRI